MPRESKTSEKNLRAVERQRQALELRKSGLGYDVIAQRLGYSGPSGAYNAIRSALKRTLQEPADEVRQIEIERLDHILMSLWPHIRPDGKDMTWCVDRALKVMERRANLLGLDAPVKREETLHITFTRLAETMAKDLDLEPAELVAEAERIIAQAARP